MRRSCRGFRLLIVLCATIKAKLWDSGCHYLYTNCLRPQFLLPVETSEGTSQVCVPLYPDLSRELALDFVGNSSRLFRR